MIASNGSNRGSSLEYRRSLTRGKQVVLVLLCLIFGATVRAYVDEPPPRHSGGFGEPTCHVCHSQYPLNEPEGGLTLEGLPESYRAGEKYTVSVRLNGEEIRAAGFQMAARFLEGSRQGEQAGTFESIDDRIKVTRAVPDDIQYAHHSAVGSRVESPEEVVWQLIWTAPPDPFSGTVIFHVAANAGNGDDSEFGDRVYVGVSTVSASVE